MKKTNRAQRQPGIASQATLAQQLSQRLRQALCDAALHLGTPAAGDEPALTVEPAREPIAPALLAAACPGDATARQEMRTLYERCLAHYRHVRRTRQAGACVDDVGAAIADFVAANMRALHGIAVTSAMRLPLERQLAGVLRASATWSSAPARDRQLYFEKLALLAVLIGESATQAVQQGPAAVAHMQQTARRYLRELLGINPDRVTLGETGLVLRATADAGVAATIA